MALRKADSGSYLELLDLFLGQDSQELSSAQKTLKIAKDNDDFVSYPSKFPSILITNLGLKKLLEIFMAQLLFLSSDAAVADVIYNPYGF